MKTATNQMITKYLKHHGYLAIYKKTGNCCIMAEKKHYYPVRISTTSIFNWYIKEGKKYE